MFWTLPTLLTWARIVAIPLIVGLYYLPWPPREVNTLAAGLFVLFWAVGAYNRLVTLKNAIANAFGQIDVQLKRRHDLIPNLVEVARQYLVHESQTLEAVIAARNQARSAEQGAAADADPRLLAQHQHHLLALNF